MVGFSDFSQELSGFAEGAGSMRLPKKTAAEALGRFAREAQKLSGAAVNFRGPGSCWSLGGLVVSLRRTLRSGIASGSL